MRTRGLETRTLRTGSVATAIRSTFGAAAKLLGNPARDAFASARARARAAQFEQPASKSHIRLELNIRKRAPRCPGRVAEIRSLELVVCRRGDVETLQLAAGNVATQVALVIAAVGTVVASGAITSLLGVHSDDSRGRAGGALRIVGTAPDAYGPSIARRPNETAPAANARHATRNPLRVPFGEGTPLSLGLNGVALPKI